MLFLEQKERGDDSQSSLSQRDDDYCNGKRKEIGSNQLANNDSLFSKIKQKERINIAAARYCSKENNDINLRSL